MPSFIRHGPTIPRRTDICLPDSSSNAFSASGDGVVSRNQSFLRTPIQRTPHEIMRRESNRLSAPSYLVRSLADVPQEYGSSQSFLTEVNFAVENGDSGSRYYYSDNFFDGQRRRPLGERVHEDYRYYEYNHDLFQRMPQNQGRHPSGNSHYRLVYIDISVKKMLFFWIFLGSQHIVKFFLFSICQSWLSLLIRGWLTYTE
jgi:scaffold protein salvador